MACLQSSQIHGVLDVSLAASSNSLMRSLAMASSDVRLSDGVCKLVRMDYAKKHGIYHDERFTWIAHVEVDDPLRMVARSWTPARAAI